MKNKLVKWLPLAILMVIFALFYVLGFNRYFNFAYLQESHAALKQGVDQNLILSLLVFGVAYIIVTATSLPVAAFLTILGGFLFGPYISLIIVDIAATLGATILFFAVRTSFGEVLKQRATPWVKKLEVGFKKNAFSYLLFLRLIPLFPFWVVTLVPGLLGVSLRSFFFATLIGIIPGTFVYALLGNGLGVLLEKGQKPDLNIIFDLEIFLPICGLAILSLLPLLYKRFKKNEKA